MTGKRIKLFAPILAIAIVAAACGGGDNGGGGGGGGGNASGATKGGTFRVGWASAFNFTDGFDPSGEYLGSAWGVYSNLMIRTLVGYKHTAGADGSTIVADAATDVPEPTDGGKTYTFHLRDGIKFGPPLSRDVTSKDYAYAFERIATKSVNAQYAFYYDGVIQGMQDFADGKADSISGIQTPDDQTISITLNEPTGDFLYRVAMPAAGPIPPEVGKCFENAGDYGRYIISSGPYMIKGADDLDTSSCKTMKPIAGFNPNKELDLVRNPDYDQSTDDYRKNYPDEFQFVVNTNVNDIYNKTQNDEYESQEATETPQILRKYVTDSSLKPLLHINSGDRTWYINFDLTQPPFDDVHVRKAVNWVMDKAGLQRAWGGPTAGEIATHMEPPTMTGGHPTGAEYDPYKTSNFAGDVDKAKEEMKQSKYGDSSGMCSDSVCKDILMFNRNYSPWTEMEPVIQSSLEKIGITVNIREFADFYTPWQDVTKTSPIASGAGWGKDYPDPLTFVGTLFDSSSILAQGNTDVPLVGLTPDITKTLNLPAGRTTTGIPSVDADIDQCTPLTGQDRIDCWVDLDKKLTEEVVPWVPYLWSNANYITADDVTAYDFDQFSGTAAWSQVAVDSSKQKGV